MIRVLCLVSFMLSANRLNVIMLSVMGPSSCGYLYAAELEDIQPNDTQHNDIQHNNK